MKCVPQKYLHFLSSPQLKENETLLTLTLGGPSEWLESKAYCVLQWGYDDEEQLQCRFVLTYNKYIYIYKSWALHHLSSICAAPPTYLYSAALLGANCKCINVSRGVSWFCITGSMHLENQRICTLNVHGTFRTPQVFIIYYYIGVMMPGVARRLPWSFLMFCQAFCSCIFSRFKGKQLVTKHGVGVGSRLKNNRLHRPVLPVPVWKPRCAADCNDGACSAMLLKCNSGDNIPWIYCYDPLNHQIYMVSYFEESFNVKTESLIVSRSKGRG